MEGAMAANFLIKYEKVINDTLTYDDLAEKIAYVIEKNVFIHMIPAITQSITRLYGTQGINSLYRELLVGTFTDNYKESGIALLSQLTALVTNDFESGIYSLDKYSLVIAFVCSQDKSFILNVESEARDEFIILLAGWFLVLKSDMTNEDDDISRNGQVTCMVYLRSSLEDVVKNMTPEEMDKKYTEMYKSIDVEMVNYVIRPFQSLIRNVIGGLNTNDILSKTLCQMATDVTDEEIDVFAEMLSKPPYNLSKIVVTSVMYNIIQISDIYNRKCQEHGAVSIGSKDTAELFLNYKELQLMNATFNDALPMVRRLILNKAMSLFNETARPSDEVYDICVMLMGAIFLKGQELYERPLDCRKLINALKVVVFTTIEGAQDIFPLDYEITNSTFEAITAAYFTPFQEDTDPALEAKKYDNWADDSSSTNEEENKRTDIKKKKTKVTNEESPSESPEEEETEEDSTTVDAKQSTKGYKKGSTRVNKGTNKFYKAYKNYKTNEQKIDSQLSKMLSAAKSAFTQDKTDEIINGKRFTPIGLLKKILGTAAIFSGGKIKGFLFLLITHTISKKRTMAQKNEILIQLGSEIKMLEEKIEDARSDGDRDAKYAMLRTKGELERARDKIKFNLTATQGDLKTAKDTIKSVGRRIRGR